MTDEVTDEAITKADIAITKEHVDMTEDLCDGDPVLALYIIREAPVVAKVEELGDHAGAIDYRSVTAKDIKDFLDEVKGEIAKLKTER